MENTSQRSINIKLPSNSAIVTVKNLWEVAKVIARTGKTFQEEHLVKNGSPINEKNLSRILSYLKYLGIVSETRNKEVLNGKEENIQRWHQQDKTKITDFFYAFKAGREEEAKGVFKDILKENDLYLGIKDELMKKNHAPTELDLEYYFKAKIPGLGPAHYQSGARFVVALLSFANLVVMEGDHLKLIDHSASEDNGNEEIHGSQNPKESKENLNSDPPTNLGTNQYLVKMVGANNFNFAFAINSTADIDDVEAILNIIRKRLSS